MDNVERYTLCRETRAQVARLHRACERGESVSESIQFCRYLMASGILRELKRNPSENLQLPFDGSLLEWEVSELHQLALAVPVTKRLGTFEERILASLDTIAGHVAKYAPPGVPSPVLAAHNPGGVQ